MADCIIPGTPAIHLQHSPFRKYNVTDLLNLHYTHYFTNRKVVYYGVVPYSYTGARHDTLELPENGLVSEIFHSINSLFHNHFNSVMVHYYENETSHMPRHSDDDPFIEANSVILSLSLGVTRTFNIYSKSENRLVKTFDLEHGDILLMSQSSQILYRHELPPATTKKNPRISLTFRKMKAIESIP